MQLTIIGKQYLQILVHRVRRIDKSFEGNEIQATTGNGKDQGKRRVDSKNCQNSRQKRKRFLKIN